MILLDPVTVVTIPLAEGHRPGLRDLEAVIVGTMRLMGARLKSADVGIEGDALTYATNFGEIHVELTQDRGQSMILRLTGDIRRAGTRITIAALITKAAQRLEEGFFVRGATVPPVSAIWALTPISEKAA